MGSKYSSNVQKRLKICSTTKHRSLAPDRMCPKMVSITNFSSFGSRLTSQQPHHQVQSASLTMSVSYLESNSKFRKKILWKEILQQQDLPKTPNDTGPTETMLPKRSASRRQRFQARRESRTAPLR